MESEAQALADRLATQDVMVRYAACLDERDWVAYRDCFAPDVEFHDFGPQVISGVDAWIEFVEGVLDRFEATQHMLGPPRIVLSGSQAELRTELAAQHFYHEPKGRIFSLWGSYRSTLVRLPERWCIRRHALETRATRTDDVYQEPR
jgi:hypothetical protein